MTRNTYLQLVRQYARLAKRMNVSYAPQVLALEKLYTDGLVTAEMGADERELLTDDIQAMTDREYGKHDRSFGRIPF